MTTHPNHPPDDAGSLRDPIAQAVAVAIGDIIAGASVEIDSGQDQLSDQTSDLRAGVARAVSDPGDDPPMGITVRLDDRLARLVADDSGPNPLAELLAALPAAGIEAAAQLRPRRQPSGGRVSTDLERAVRDTVAAEVLNRFVETQLGRTPRIGLLSETIDYLLELSGSRVEAEALTHGVVISDVLDDAPLLAFAYPQDLRPAKRAPLLFDGQQSVLIIDSQGRARTEIESHAISRRSLMPEGLIDGFTDSQVADLFAFLNSLR